MPKLNFSWTANDPNQQVLDYTLRISRNGTPITPDVVTTQNSYELDNPAAGVYSAVVRARNIAGDSAFSASGQGPTVPSTPPAPVITTIP